MDIKKADQSIIEIKDQELKCQDCDTKTTVKFNEGEVAWYKCVSSQCKKPKKDIMDIFKQNQVKMQDKRIKSVKCLVSILTDSNNLPQYQSDQNEEIFLEDVQFESVQSLENALTKMNLNEPKSVPKSPYSDASTTVPNTPNTATLTPAQSKSTTNQSKVKGATETKGKQETEDLVPLSDSEVVTYMMSKQSLVIDPEYQSLRMFRQAKQEVITADSKTLFQFKEGSVILHLKKNCGNLKVPAKCLPKGSIKEVCATCMDRFWNNHFTLWFCEIQKLPVQ